MISNYLHEIVYFFLKVMPCSATENVAHSVGAVRNKHSASLCYDTCVDCRHTNVTRPLALKINDN